MRATVSSRASDPATRTVADDGRMTESLVSRLCKASGGYRTPELNEKLYLHFHGFRKIEGLEAFVNCRALWLENNLLTEIEGLDGLERLDSLYLQHNSIRHLPAHASLASLRSLNVSYNFLTSLSGIECMPALEKLLASHNEIEDISGISALPNLSVLDISHNKIVDGDAARSVLQKSKLLASLMMHGNEVVRQVKQYRKVMIVENEALKYLDEYPVFDDERRCASAFMRGGLEAEKEERAAIRSEELARQEAQRKFFNNLVETSRNKRGKEPVAPTPYFQQQLEDDDSIFVPAPAAASLSATQQAAASASVQDPRKVGRAAARRQIQQQPRHADPFAGTNAAATIASVPKLDRNSLENDIVEQSEGDVLALFQLDDLVRDELKQHLRADAWRAEAASQR